VGVQCMGAVNAVAVLAALPPAALWLLTRAPGPRRRRLLGWWVGCVLLACAWWLVPLLLLGRYSPPFLNYIESASTTTAVTSLIEVLRGTSDWIAYLVGGGGPIWPAGFALLTERMVIAYTLVVVLAGIAGLLRRDLPERLWLTACLLSGVAAVTAGHLGAVGGLLAGVEHAQLDAALAPLRNVHKFDVVLRLPLVLGLAHLVGRLLSTPVAATSQRRHQLVVTVAAAAAVLGAALPALSVGLAPRHPFTAIPSYWRQTAGWLAQHQSQGRALLVPGSSFPDYLWGSSNDEPLQPLASSPWVVRSAVPLTPGGTIRALDAVERELQQGHGSSGLAAYLRGMGIGYVVMRNDLDYGAAGSARPILVHEAVLGSPGIRRVRGFGPELGGAPHGGLVDEGLDLPYRSVEVYAIDGAAPRAELHDLAGTPVVTGGPESVLALDDAGLLGGRVTLLAQDAAGVPELASGPRLLTDGLRRREVSFGRLADNASATLTADERLHLDAPASDYVDRPAGDQATVARLVGARALSASSSASDAGSFGGSRPENLPYAAVDGDPATSWRSDPARGLRGAYWRIDFAGGARDLHGVRVVLGGRRFPASIRLAGDAGAVDVRVPRSGVVTADLPGPSRSLEVRSLGRARLGWFDVAEVTVPGLHVRRTLVPPAVDRADAVVLTVAEGRRGCFLVLRAPVCSAGVARGSEEAGGLDRTLTLRQAADYTPSLLVRPVAGAALNSLLDKGSGVEVTASSSAIADPYGRPATVYDGRVATGWRADGFDQDPWLRLRWATPQRIAGLRLRNDVSLAASLPGRVTVLADGGAVVHGAVDRQGRLDFPSSLLTRTLTLHLRTGTLRSSADPFSKTFQLLPVGVSELELTGARPVTTPVSRIRIPCGQGPTMVIGGTRVPTRVDASRDDLLARETVAALPCTPGPVTIVGTTEVSVPSTATLQPVRLVLTAGRAPVPAAGRRLDTPRWGPASRRIALPERAASTLLQVHENTNPGWQATLGGRRLRPVVLDGWQQGWLVPAGPAGVVQLRYAPDGLYRGALGLGGVLALVLLLLAGPGGRSPAASAPARATRPVAVGLLLGVLLLIGGPVALAAAVAGAFVVRRTQTAAGIAVIAVGSAGALLVLRPWATPGYLGRSAAAQTLCVIALALIWAALTTDASWRGWATVTLRRRRDISGRSMNR
jgi:arabinofuranan 3-O-arabinosyltransferase